MCTKRRLWFPFTRSKCQRKKNKRAKTYLTEMSIFGKKKSNGTLDIDVNIQKKKKKKKHESDKDFIYIQ